MLVEFTGTDNNPLFVNPEEVAAIESKKKHTLVHLRTGVALKVLETPAEVYFDLNNKMMELALENVPNL